ncbi:MAG: AAA family ATPase [Candidatus Synoicihabitans palmerolidicus]|nr:AAA family ATPase [Candidatus Synoicihabitans palmerolidicus]
MARKIAFINHKGGVGKTSLLVNIATSLAILGKRVLIYDFDTQSNASIWLLRLDRWNKINASSEGAIYSIFEPATQRVKDVVWSKNDESSLPGLDIVTTTFNLVNLENEYRGEPSRPPYVIFRDQLAEIEDAYDFILFDCPPNILRASQCGIFCANEIYVPSNPDALSLIEFTLLVEKLGKFHQLSVSFRISAQGVPAQVQGIIFNSIKTGVDIDVPRMRMQLRLNQYRSAKRVAPKAKLFGQHVRDAMIVRRAVTLGLPVAMVNTNMDSGGDETVVDDYRKVAAALLRHGDDLNG